jgi:hypothetical protein
VRGVGLGGHVDDLELVLLLLDGLVGRTRCLC